MLDIDSLRKFGADVDSGLGRCLNNEAFYLNLVEKSINDEAFNRLNEAIQEKDLEVAFETAHSLKGVMGNLSLTPIYDPVVEITELLRSRTEMDYSELISTINAKKEELSELCN